MSVDPNPLSLPQGMMFEELAKSSPFAIIDLYELQLFANLHGTNEIYRFHNGTNGKFNPTGDIIWKGYSYMAVPIEMEGFEYTGSGQLPRPKIRVANLLSTISAILININETTPGNDLTGAKLTRIRTLSRFLDSANFADGVNPHGQPDPESEAPQEIYYVDRKTAENRDFVEFELASRLDLAGVRAPKRQCIANVCQWIYRSSECGYTGTIYLDENDNYLNASGGTNFTSNFTPAGGYSDQLLAGDEMFLEQQLASANGWYILRLGPKGDLFIRAKNQQTNLGFLWQTGTGGQGGYRLTMQADGNLVLYTSDNTVVWASNTKGVGAPTAVQYHLQYFSNGAADPGASWDPRPQLLDESGNITRTGYVGHRLAFFFEIFGQAVLSGLTRTEDHTFNLDDGRTITMTFSVTSVALSAGHWSGQSYGWADTATGSYPQPTAITGSSGDFTGGTNFQGRINLSTSNPFRSTPYGRMSYVAATFTVSSTTNTANRAVIQNDGNLVLYDSSNNVIYDVGISYSSEPLIQTDTGNPLDDVCGKRLSSCRARFGENAPLPFGSFPGIGTLTD